MEIWRFKEWIELSEKKPPLGPKCYAFANQVVIWKNLWTLYEGSKFGFQYIQVKKNNRVSHAIICQIEKICNANHGGQKFSQFQSVRSQSAVVHMYKENNGVQRSISIKLTQKMKKIDSLLHWFS